jgi:hypothetical protein
MNTALEPRFIIETAERLRRRIDERFPKSGLLKVADSVLRLAREADERSALIAKPYIPLRVAAWSLGGVLALGVGAAFMKVRVPGSIGNIAELLQGADAAANLTLLLGAAILSVVKLEENLRRKKALALVHELKALAHVVDMHQLTKDPETVSGDATRTESSPKRTMTPFELGRYLDYSSEMLSVLGKIAAIYAQRLQDPVVLEAVDGAEDLATGLSRKIWQKIAILSDRSGSARA